MNTIHSSINNSNNNIKINQEYVKKKPYINTFSDKSSIQEIEKYQKKNNIVIENQENIILTDTLGG